MLPDPAVQPLLTVDEFVACAGGRLGRTAVYEACRRGEITSRRIGRKLFIPTAAAWRIFGLDPPGRDDGGTGAPPSSTLSPTPFDRHRRQTEDGRA